MSNEFEVGADFVLFFFLYCVFTLRRELKSVSQFKWAILVWFCSKYFINRLIILASVKATWELRALIVVGIIDRFIFARSLTFVRATASLLFDLLVDGAFNFEMID